MNDKQRISWETYKLELNLMMMKTREIRKKLLRKARTASRRTTGIALPIKILLGTSSSATFSQIVDDSDSKWILYTSLGIQLLVIVLTQIRDTFNFEARAERFISAARAVESVYDAIRNQSFLEESTVEDRYEALLSVREMYSTISKKHDIIQLVESLSGSETPEQDLESADTSTTTTDDSVEHGTVPRYELRRKTNERNRMMYLHKMVEEIN